MADVTITVRKNGPYIVSGPVEVRDADGNVYPGQGDGGALPLRRVHEQAVLRRHPLEGGLPGRGAGGPRVGRGVGPAGRQAGVGSTEHVAPVVQAGRTLNRTDHGAPLAE